MQSKVRAQFEWIRRALEVAERLREARGGQFGVAFRRRV